MREIHLDQLGKKFSDLINEEHPLEEDIGVLDDKGNLKGVFITSDAYQFFLRKIEEAEDQADIASAREFNQSGEKDK